MERKKPTKKTAKGHHELERDRAGDLFADFSGEAGEPKVRVSIRRNWYSPPFSDDGEVDFERAAEELSSEVTGCTLVVRRYLESGDLGFATEIPVASEKELEHILQTMRSLYVESLQHENAIRLAGLEACSAAISRNEQRAQRAEERRQERERRLLRRRGRQLLGSTWFRKDDRRAESERRMGADRRSRQGRVSNPHQ